MSAFHRVGENKNKDAIALFDTAIRLAPKRVDLVLRRSEVLALIPGQKDAARAIMEAMAAETSTAPASVIAEALMDLAHDAAGSGDHQKEREYMIAAFVKAPKSMQMTVLNELAFCLRGLRDFKGAMRYMELSSALEPNNPDLLYSLAILQNNAGDLKNALVTVGKARMINPESWYLAVLESGFLVALGQKEQGMKQFVAIEKPRAEEEFWEIMQAWFYAETRQKQVFFKQFAKAFEIARSSRILEWVDQDPDIDVYRNEPEFQAIVEKHRARLTGK